jgi:hypothetical protein
MQDHIDNFVVLADIFGGCRDDAVHHLTEEKGITARVVSYSGNKFCDCLLVLKENVRYKNKSGNNITYFRDILQINN